MKKKFIFNALDFYLVILLLTLVLVKDSTIGDPGIGWHLKNGEVITSSVLVPRSDQFLVSLAPLKWISDQWAADVILYMLYAVGGFSLLHLFTALISILAYGVVIGREVVRESPSDLSAFFILMVVFLNGYLQWFCRPLLFSFLFFAIFYVLMRRFLADSNGNLRDFCFKTFFLFAIWSNLHPGFAVAAVIFAASFLEILLSNEARKSAKLGGIVALSCTAFLATLFNPYGIELHRSIVSLISSDFFMKLNVEWLAPEIGDLFFSGFYLGVLLLISSLAFIPASLFRRFDLFSVGILAFLSFQQRRYIPFFAIPLGLVLASSAMAIAQGKCRVPLRDQPVLRLIFRTRDSAPRCSVTATAIVSLLLVVYLTLFKHLPLKTEAELGFTENFPKKAATYLSHVEGSGSIFATPDWGGFLIWHLWPEHKLFIDDRNTLIGEQRYRDFFTIRDLLPGWQELLERYQFSYLLVTPKDKIALQLTASKDWNLVEQGSDDKALLFVRAVLP